MGVKNHFIYKGTAISQHPDIIYVLHENLKILKPSRIVEIGTLNGGLTLLLSDILDSLNLSNSLIRTYDIHEQPGVSDKFKDIDRIEYRLIDAFSNEEEFNDLTDFINQPGLTMVFCDGGNKEYEFNTLAPVIKNGDIILGHDYAPDYKYFFDNIFNKTWNWIEIADCEIERVCDKHNLIPFNQDEFLSVVWCCRIKSNDE